MYSVKRKLQTKIQKLINYKKEIYPLKEREIQERLIKTKWTFLIISYLSKEIRRKVYNLSPGPTNRYEKPTLIVDIFFFT